MFLRVDTYDPVEYPPKSLNLTSLVFLWSHLKTVIYASPYINLQDSKNKTIYISRQLIKQYILSVTSTEINRRLIAYLSLNGANYIQFI